MGKYDDAILEWRDVSLERGSVKVALEWIEEGTSGDYDPEDDDDTPLLRFTVFKDEEQVQYGSFCTLMPITITPTQAYKVVVLLMDAFYDAVMGEESIKTRAEDLSWMNPDWESLKEGGVE